MSKHTKGRRPGALWILLLGVPAAMAADLSFIELPSGFTVELYADDLADARSMTLAPDGTLFVGSRRDGRLHALRDTDGDGRADRRWLLAQGLDMPNGVAFHQGDLYVAESGGIWRYAAILDRLAKPPEPVRIAELPAYGHHGWRYLAMGPDGYLYVAMGAPCNVCDPGELGAIWRVRPDGSGLETYARGVRNSVGMTWHPDTAELWFTDNGRDWLGDDLPPDELNRAPRPGLHFGFPHCHGMTLADPEYGKSSDCGDYVAPMQELGAHVASLGLRFYTGSQFPEAYRGQLFVAEHGSWNRSEKAGYRVSLLRLSGDKVVGYEPFAWGWWDGKRVHGRPVDLQPLPDGSLLISDDAAGRIYRISYRER